MEAIAHKNGRSAGLASAESRLGCELLTSAPASEDWLLWQLADSAFPTGGFAHSAGLEAAWQHGEVRNSIETQSFLKASLTQVGRAMLPFVTAAHAEPARLGELDHLCEAFTANHVANRASRLQGRAFLASSESIFGHPQIKIWRQVSDQVPPYSHFAPLFGACLNVLGVPFENTGRLFLFQHLRGLLAAAIRLGVVGPLEAQSLQQRLSILAEQTWIASKDLTTDEIAQTAPLLEIWQAGQDRLYSRLFQS